MNCDRDSILAQLQRMRFVYILSWLGGVSLFGYLMVFVLQTLGLIPTGARESLKLAVNLLFFGGFIAMLVGVSISNGKTCPRCGKTFFERPPKSNGPGDEGYVNVFSSKCLNCGLKIDGSNLDHESV